jgi:hypothetical protein
MMLKNTSVPKNATISPIIPVKAQTIKAQAFKARPRAQTTRAARAFKKW